MKKEDLLVGQAAGWTDTPRPVGYAQRVDDLRTLLMELAPEARGPCIGIGRKGVHRDAAPSGIHRNAGDEAPQCVGDGWAKDGVHIHVLAEVLTRTGDTIDALGREGEARDVIRQEVHVRRSRSPIEP